MFARSSAAAALMLLAASGAMAANITYVGCYSGVPLDAVSEDMFMSTGMCYENCFDPYDTSSTSVEALSKGSTCYCGGKMPEESLMVDDDKCDAPCNGYGVETCGSSDGTYYSIYLTGAKDLAEIDTGSAQKASSTSSASSSSSTGSSNSTSGNSTVSPTSSAAPSATDAENAAGMVQAAKTLALAVPLFAVALMA